ncbi:exopolyphosphatase/guanosine-5'-triphosphate,3'-diphosphate pyrophosphatase [Jatrophihabitans sp. GAS493]|uniref:Ppx/GppA phosphatase family protein n=1 Tax=Jatrophihabitans sp. GAS493 TaxID=1907575 RepID=UPI000BB881EF|nr:Ppx/GppA phosphatase family protein [Jatrophihabitans sp. GAS493]SOD75189.1 exopolyphosphatase/guanosine-5'-triphosphate,3'-diphosphate pyrophosphatase [Jatrophihabitans sp. GAS493]
MSFEERRVAAIDCGTNSVRLLVNSVFTDSELGTATRQLAREMRIVRLGQGVDRTGRLDPAAIERTRLALEEYRRVINYHEVDTVRMVATSATRDAGNRADFVAMVQSTLGIEPEVVTGVEEAQLSFNGAVDGLDSLVGAVLVTDIGGGSTELVRGLDPGNTGSGALAAFSMDVGAVRLTERHLRDDPPTPGQLSAAASDVAAALEVAGQSVDLAAEATLVGVAGTVTTLAAMALHLPAYDSAAIHGSTLTRDQVATLTRWLSEATHDERAAVPVIHPGRVDVITAGALILGAVMGAAGAAQIIVSEHDILDGIAASL